MAKTGEIVRYLDDLLRIAEIKDYTSNGLQVEGCAEVETVGFAVDSCEAVFEALSDCQMIVCHHGLWWPSVERMVGIEVWFAYRTMSIGLPFFLRENSLSSMSMSSISYSSSMILQRDTSPTFMSVTSSPEESTIL